MGSNFFVSCASVILFFYNLLEPPLPPAKLDALHGSELQLYTWKDTSLREIVDLVKDVCPEARIRSSRLSLKLLHLG